MKINTQSQPGQSMRMRSIKETYHKPELIVYGNIRDLTKNVEETGNPDGGPEVEENKTGFD